jgi:hypothetical protein
MSRAAELFQGALKTETTLPPRGSERHRLILEGHQRAHGIPPTRVRYLPDSILFYFRLINKVAMLTYGKF